MTYNDSKSRKQSDNDGHAPKLPVKVTNHIRQRGVVMDIVDLADSPLQPDGRNKNWPAMQKSLQATGQLSAILVQPLAAIQDKWPGHYKAALSAGQHYVKVTGHGRSKALMDIGETTVRADVLDTAIDHTDAYTAASAHQRGHTGKHWFETWLNDSSAKLPPSHKHACEVLLNIFGTVDEVEKYVHMYSKSPHIGQTINTVANLMAQSSNTRFRKYTLRQIGQWMCVYAKQGVIRSYLESGNIGQKLEQIANAIDDERDIKWKPMSTKTKKRSEE